MNRPLAVPDEVADFLRVPKSTLTYWRTKGKGPKFARYGKHVRYDWQDVHDWLKRQATTEEAA